MIIDGHLDLAFNAADLGRDVSAPLAEIRRHEGSAPPYGEGTATVSLPALRAAGVRIALATLFTYPEEHPPPPLPGYRTPEEARRRALAQYAAYQRLEAAGEITLLRDQRGLDDALAGRGPAPALVLLMEGADPIRTPAELGEFTARGVRVVGLAWRATRYAGGAGAPGPLTAAGAELLREMDRLGVALDASHLDEEAFGQALRLFRGRVVATHANCRALVPGPRQLSDEMIRAIADRDGVIGVMLYNPFLKAGWTREDGKEAVGLADVVRHVDHLRRLVGERHIALGSDLDGGVGREVIPRELDSAADLPQLAKALDAAGYTPEAISAIMWQNWRRVLRAILPD